MIDTSQFGLVFNQSLENKATISYLKMFSGWLPKLKIHHDI
jgi:hypothetical protein